MALQAAAPLLLLRARQASGFPMAACVVLPQIHEGGRVRTREAHCSRDVPTTTSG